jgi:hypothetical protein
MLVKINEAINYDDQKGGARTKLVYVTIRFRAGYIPQVQECNRMKKLNVKLLIKLVLI